ncbi:FHA domain-containing protein [Haliangium sp.]|uniref:FHA domain-containing protein n=1 Tax=Haliangium sp. TaxID=2663208 RepID=UPI003D138CEC
MALLRHIASHESHALRALHLAGRARRHDLWLTNPRASTTHAELYWADSAWEVRDLGSSNGTFVGARRLVSGERMKIERGVRVAFGDLEDPFEVINDDPPVVMAKSHGGRVIAAGSRTLAMPDPESLIYEVMFVDQESRWVAEGRERPRFEVHDGDWIEAGGEMWQLFLPQEGSRTLRKPSFFLNSLTLRVIVRGDHTAIELEQGGDKRSFQHRAHHELIYVLAHARLRDADEASLPPSEHGWVDAHELPAMLSKSRDGNARSENWIDVAVHRIREMFDKAGVINASEAIERQPGEIRLGVGKIELIAP